MRSIILPAAKKFAKMGFNIFATPGTAEFLKANGVKVKSLHKISEKTAPNVLEAVTNHDVDLIVNIPSNYSSANVTDGYLIRRKALDLNIPLITNVQIAKIMAEALQQYGVDDLKIKDVDSYF